MFVNPSIVIGCNLIDIIGQSRTSGSIILVPALINFDAIHESVLEFPLDSEPAAQHLSILATCDVRNAAALWVRARIPAAFAFTPLSCESSTQPSTKLFNCGFLAISLFPDRTTLTAHPFACGESQVSEEEEQSCVGLHFGSAGTDVVTKGQIAAAFWSILLEAPDDLRSFSHWRTEEQYDLVAVRKAGYERGVFYDEIAYYFDDEMRWQFLIDWDGHIGSLADDRLACIECGGTGEESFCPAGEPCEICGGTGRFRS